MRWFGRGTDAVAAASAPIPSSAAPVSADPTPSAAADPAQTSPVDAPNQWLVTMIGGTSSSGQRVTDQTVMTLPAVMQALRILCGVFAMTPLVYYRRAGGGKARADDTAQYRLLHDDPNLVQTPFAFKEMLLADVLLAGNHYSWISRDYRQDPVALTRLETGYVQPVKTFTRERGYEQFYDATLPDHTRERFPSRSIWHVQGFSRTGLTGLSPLHYMRDALGGGLAAQDFANRFFANNARPGVTLTSKLKIDAPVKRQIKADWIEANGGHNANGVTVLDQELEPKFLVFDNEKNQLIETRTFSVLDVARCFGVPPHLLFELSKATFGNIEHQSLEFVLYHMMPHYVRVAEAATKSFAAPDCFYEFLPDALLRGDVKARWEAYRAARETGALNANEIRARENLNPIPGAAGTDYLRPANMAVAGQPQETP